MAKRKSSLILCEFIEVVGTRSTRVREVTAEHHRILGRLAINNATMNGYDVEIPMGVFGSNGRGEFKLYRKSGEYFTTDEFTHLAAYLGGAADALEAAAEASS